MNSYNQQTRSYKNKKMESRIKPKKSITITIEPSLQFTDLPYSLF